MIFFSPRIRPHRAGAKALARSALVRPSRRPSSTSAWRTQARSVPGRSPSCCAVGLRPRWRTR